MKNMSDFTSNSSPNPAPAPSSNLGPLLKVPWLKIMFGIIAVAFAIAILWSICAPLWGWEGWQMAARAVVAVLPVALVGWVITAPWRPRFAIDLITVWLAGTVVRLLLTPLACLALYSQAPCDKSQFVVAVGACYFAVVLAEVGMIAFSLPRAAVGDARQ